LEEPCVPLRAWIVGYLLQGVFHSLCVVVEFRRRRSHSSSSLADHNGAFSSGSDEEYYASDHFLEDEGNRYTSINFNLVYSFCVLLIS
jgi:hypothetical protein